MGPKMYFALLSFGNTSNASYLTAIVSFYFATLTVSGFITNQGTPGYRVNSRCMC